MLGCCARSWYGWCHEKLERKQMTRAAGHTWLLLWQVGKDVRVVGKRNQRGDQPRRGNNFKTPRCSHHSPCGEKLWWKKPHSTAIPSGSLALLVPHCTPVGHISSLSSTGILSAKWCYRLFLCCLRVEKNPIISDNLPELKTITVSLLSGHAVIYILEQTLFAPIISPVITVSLGSKIDLNQY